jgi:hypothetical protein
VWVGSASPSTARAAAGDDITMTVDSVTPLTPTATHASRSFSVQLTLHTTSEHKDVRITAERGSLISTQRELDAAIAHPAPPTGSGLPIPADPPMQPLSLDAGATATVTFTTTTSIQADGSSGICLCAPALIYQLFFSAHVTGEGGVDQRLGVVSTFVPSFDGAPPEGAAGPPPPLHVGWIWPLIDRPHRLTGETQFTDDQLAASVGAGGRLARALEVVAQLPSDVPITLLIDPELLDELWVMAHETYTVGSGKQATPGTGKDVAAAWLDELHAALDANPDVQVVLTPYGDPDVQATAGRGLTWSTALSGQDVSRHVAETLAGRSLDSTLAWPASGAISQHTLDLLAKQDVSTVVLDSRAIAPQTAAGAGLARLAVHGADDVAAVLTSATVEKYVAQSITLGGAGAVALPSLVAELAVRTTQDPTTEHAVVLTAPRYVDPDVTAAVSTIRATSTSPFTRPIALPSAVNSTLLPTGFKRLAAAQPGPASPTIGAAAHAAGELGGIRSLLDRRDPAARAFLAGLPIAIQRAESAAWSDKLFAGAAAAFANDLSTTVDTITTGVTIGNPQGSSYTLGSRTADLPITVDNALPYAVNVRVRITTDPAGLPGFSTKPLPVQHVDSKQKKTVKIHTTADARGRIRINAVLLTPDNVELSSQSLTVRSTALGFIGVLITIIAGAVLALALIVRFTRRWHQHRRAKTLPLPPVQADEPEPAT